MTNKLDLKPCPFCGGEVTMEEVGMEGTDDELWVISCQKCGMGVSFPEPDDGEEGVANANKQQTIEAWNRRVSNERN